MSNSKKENYYYHTVNTVEKIKISSLKKELAQIISEYISDNYFEDITFDEQYTYILNEKDIKQCVEENIDEILSKLKAAKNKDGLNFYNLFWEIEPYRAFADRLAKSKQKVYKQFLRNAEKIRKEEELKSLKDKAKELGYKLVKEESNDSKKQNKTSKVTKHKQPS